MTDVALSLVAHTNVGKTTLARTLLGRDVGAVRDAPHVTEFADRHLLLASTEGDRLWLWDTPGFGDSVRLVRRMRQQGRPLGWLLSTLWDRWRDRAFWASQQALKHVRDESDLLLYLVNAAEPEAGWLEPELELLAWTGKPVLVLLNQVGAPRPAAEEAAEVEAWRARVRGWSARWPTVRGVLPLDAFARCWVQEAALLDAVAAALPRPEQAAALGRLRAAWQAAQQARFDAAMAALAASLGRIAATRVALDDDAPALGASLRGLRGLLERLRGADDDAAGAGHRPESLARARLAERLQDEVRTGTAQLIERHGLVAADAPAAAGTRDAVLDDVLARVAGQVSAVERLSEGRAALWGGAVTGALAGLKADIASGGLTLGGGLLAGGLIGALSAAGVARGLNVVRGSERSWAAWDEAALAPIVEAALLRYLAVAHFGRGRGGWQPGEAPPHWGDVVRAAIEPDRDAWHALWRTRGRGAPDADGTEDAAGAAALAAGAQPLLAAAARRALAALYPGLAAAAVGGSR